VFSKTYVGRHKIESLAGREGERKRDREDERKRGREVG
jgi:hypothetical protein